MTRSEAQQSIPWLKAAALAALVLPLGACFHISHDLPQGAYFGTLPQGERLQGSPYDQWSMKNWALAGLVPYTSFNAGNMIPAPMAGQYVKISSIETVFTALDVGISIVPGYFYGYYVWAPRSIKVRAQMAEPADAPRR